MTQISIVREFSITSMKGGYRRVLQRPIDCEWIPCTSQLNRLLILQGPHDLHRWQNTLSGDWLRCSIQSQAIWSKWAIIYRGVTWWFIGHFWSNHPSRDRNYWQLRSVTRACRKIKFYSTDIILCYNGYQGADEDFNFGWLSESIKLLNLQQHASFAKTDLMLNAWKLRGYVPSANFVQWLILSAFL